MIQTTSSEKQNNETKPKQKWGEKEKGWIIAVIAIVSLCIFLIVLTDRGEKSTSSSASQVIQYTTQTGTPERTIEEKAIQILGEKTNMGKRKIRGIKVEDDKALIVFMADENLTTNLARRGMWTDITKLLEELPSQIDPKIKYLIFAADFPLVDQYGKESIDEVMLVTVTKQAWERIDWDNFLKENLSKIADSYWEHPALSK